MAWSANRSEETDHEGAGFSKENLPQLQDRTAQGCRVRDLQ
jgi:hypothetical protein